MATKKNRVLIVLLASVTIAAVFFALNETFAWLSFFKTGQGQKFEAGYIDTAWTPSYAVYTVDGQALSAYGRYVYLPGDDLCEGPRVTDAKNFRRLGFNLAFSYVTQSACVVRFKVEYQNTYKDPETEQNVTTALKPAFDKVYDYGTGANREARDASMILTSFAGAFVCGGLEAGTTYWYYGTKSGNTITDTVLASATSGASVNGGSGIFTYMELAGDNIGIDTGKITIRITAQIRQYEADTVTWSNYTESHFDL